MQPITSLLHLIKQCIIDNHYFWSNRLLSPMKSSTRNILEQDLEIKSKHIGLPIPDIDWSKRDKRGLLNNCVKPSIGLHVFECVFKIRQNTVGDFLSPKGESLIEIK